MKFLIVFACALAAVAASGSHIVAPVAVEAHHVVAPVYHAPQHLPVIGPNGVPIDTPAVQHAKAAHFAHKVEAHARNGDFAVVAPVAHHVHHAPVVAAHTPVVAAHTPIVADHHHHHFTPAAYPTTAAHPTSVNGVPLETPEVVAAKTHHFAAHAEALARNGHFHHYRYARGIYTPYAYGAYHNAYAYGAYPYYY